MNRALTSRIVVTLVLSLIASTAFATTTFSLKVGPKIGIDGTKVISSYVSYDACLQARKNCMATKGPDQMCWCSPDK